MNYQPLCDKRIRELVGDLQKLEFGCAILCKDFEMARPVIRFYAGTKYNVQAEAHIQQVATTEGNLYPLDNNYEILGKPIELSDVLLAIRSIKKTGYYFRLDGTFFLWNDFGKLGTSHDVESTFITYNISLPFSNQQPKVYEFIYQLIKE